MIVCGTGHRPDKLGGYFSDYMRRCADIAKLWMSYQKDELIIISGMAQGWDQALALACYEMEIPWIAAVPFEGQDCKWPQAARDTYSWLLSKAGEIIYVCEPGYANYKMHTRNEFMVNNSDMVLAYWDGSPGGTGACVKYAEKKGKPVFNLAADRMRS